MRVAVIGAGFAGVATCWHLLQHHDARRPVHVTLFDPGGIGSATDTIGSALLHPYPGKKAKLTWQATTGMDATRELLHIAAETLEQPVADYSGVFRPAVSDQQREDFLRSALRHDDIQWWSPNKAAEFVPGMQPLPGIFIRSGITVYSRKYLLGLWEACQNYGAFLELRAIYSLQELANFDVVVVTAGASSKNIVELRNLPITLIKGQTIELAWPKGVPPLPLSLISDGYVAMAEGGETCIVGATFEREFSTLEPTPTTAIPELRAKVEAYFPALKGAMLMACRSGIRAASHTRPLPLVGPVNDRCWVFTGLGSKGLLHHAWLAEQLALAIVERKFTHKFTPPIS